VREPLRDSDNPDWDIDGGVLRNHLEGFDDPDILSEGYHARPVPAPRPTLASDKPTPVRENKPIPRKQTGYVSAGREYEHYTDELGRTKRRTVGSANGRSIEGAGRDNADSPLSNPSGTGADPTPRGANGAGHAIRTRRGRGLSVVDAIRNTVDPDIASFESATFEASVKDIKFATGGDAVLQLVVPYSHRKELMKMVDSYGLSIVIKAIAK
jgi:hypothetical protein